MKPRFVTGGLMAVAYTLVAAPGDERWGREFYAPDFGTVHSIAYTPNGDLICGGVFANVAGVPGTANIARWDGTNWQSIGGGLASGTVYAVLAVGTDIYMAGLFTSVQGQNITNVARWNGTNWSAVGGGVTGGSARALAWHDGALFIGGLFTSAGGNPVGYVTAWNGSSWNTLGGGVQASNPSGAEVPITGIFSFDGNVYAGGRFFSAGGANANNVARWNGSGWESLGTGANNGTDGPVGTFAGMTNGMLYVGGSFVHAGSSTVNNIAGWDGTSWSALDGGVTDLQFAGVGGLVGSGTNLIVCGNFNRAGTNLFSGMAQWDGSRWSNVVFPGRHPMNRIVAHGSRMTAAGRLASPLVGSGKNGLFHFDGVKWSIMGASVAGVSDATSVRTVGAFNGKVQLSGYFGISDGSGLRPTVVNWDGNNWSVMGNGLPVSQLDLPRRVYDFTGIGGMIHAAGPDGNVNIFSNDTWLALAAPLSSSARSLAEYRGEIYAGHGTGISRWAGYGWTNVGVGLNGAVNDLLVLGDNLYAGGNFNTAGGLTVNKAARWDGTNWSALGMGVDNEIHTLAHWQGQLYAGGSFFLAGQGFAFAVARWDGTNWFPLGPGLGNGFPSEVHALTVLSDGRLFAAGNFSQSGLTTVSNVAWWDGTKWNPLGSGINGIVRGMAADENDLYFAGQFTVAGNASSLRFARWRYPQDFRLSLSTSGTNSMLRARGELGRSFALESSSDLTNWIAISTNLMVVNPLPTPFPNMGASHLFFRARSVP